MVSVDIITYRYIWHYMSKQRMTLMNMYLCKSFFSIHFRRYIEDRSELELDLKKLKKNQ